MRNQRGEAVVDGNKDAEVAADFVNASGYTIVLLVRRIGTQIGIELHSCAEAAALVDIESDKYGFAFAKRVCLFLERKEQVFDQSPA